MTTQVLYYLKCRLCLHTFETLDDEDVCVCGGVARVYGLELLHNGRRDELGLRRRTRGVDRFEAFDEDGAASR